MSHHDLATSARAQLAGMLALSLATFAAFWAGLGLAEAWPALAIMLAFTAFVHLGRSRSATVEVMSGLGDERTTALYRARGHADHERARPGAARLVARHGRGRRAERDPQPRRRAVRRGVRRLVPGGRAAGLAVRGLAEQPLDEHAVAPLAVEPAVAALDPDLLEAGRAMHRAAGGVGGEHARGQLVVAAALRGGAQRLEQRAPDARARGRRPRRRRRAPPRRRRRSGRSTGSRGRSRAACRRPRRRGTAGPRRASRGRRRRSRGAVSNVASRPAMPSL